MTSVRHYPTSQFKVLPSFDDNNSYFEYSKYPKYLKSNSNLREQSTTFPDKIFFECTEYISQFKQTSHETANNTNNICEKLFYVYTVQSNL